VFALAGSWRAMEDKEEERIAARAASFASFRRSGGKEGKRRSVSGSMEVCGELGLEGLGTSNSREAPPDKRKF